MNGGGLASSWIICLKRSSHQASLRLFCFHHAGGSAAAYKAWSDALGDRIEVCAVQTPGRQNLFALPRHQSLKTLVPELVPRLRPLLDRHFAFFGHSLGALTAFATSIALRDAQLPTPSRLFLSGCRPPHLPNARPNLSGAPEPELIEALMELGSQSLPALQNLELRQLMLPILRDDLRMAENYRHQAGAALRCPVSAFAGADDASATPDALNEWRQYTVGNFGLRTFSGGHFFVEDAQAAVLEAVRRDLEIDQGVAG
jgi:surfactin synthase thioesterase subunit